MAGVRVLPLRAPARRPLAQLPVLRQRPPARTPALSRQPAIADAGRSAKALRVRRRRQPARRPGAGLVVYNKLLTCQDKRYRYDAFGRMIEKRSAARGVQHFAYDAEHRLIQVRSQKGARETVVNMTYDPLGRRIAKTEHDSRGLPLDGELYKYGKADMNRVTKSSGNPTRLHQQVEALERLNPGKTIRGTVQKAA
jgi:YD repeat-containing protein